MSRIDKIAYEYGLSKEQATTFESFVAEKFAGNIWRNTKPEEWYEQMAGESLHAARVVKELAKALWNIDLEEIYRELSQEEIRQIYLQKLFGKEIRQIYRGF